jgi:hypothetical protein
VETSPDDNLADVQLTALPLLACTPVKAHRKKIIIQVLTGELAAHKDGYQGAAAACCTSGKGNTHEKKHATMGEL